MDKFWQGGTTARQVYVYKVGADFLRGACGAKEVIAAHAPNVTRVPFPQGIIDIDTWEDHSEFSAGGALGSEACRCRV